MPRPRSVASMRAVIGSAPYAPVGTALLAVKPSRAVPGSARWRISARASGVSCSMAARSPETSQAVRSRRASGTTAPAWRYRPRTAVQCGAERTNAAWCSSRSSAQAW
ncbi:hypothetical protein LUX05_13795 [Streptomyces somaliensis]|nr:hypothetical protein [Streptomyces somaliensis]